MTENETENTELKKYRVSWVEYHSKIVEVETEEEAYDEVGERAEGAVGEFTDNSLIEWETTEVTELKEREK